MVGAAALGLGMYAVSLSGEWTEAELKEKRMVSPTLLAFHRVVVDCEPCLAFRRR